MAQDHIRYDVLTQDALRGVVRKVLSEVAKAGLPGEHHFFISFATRAPGVRISKNLLDQYDREMTIVVQNQFWDLKASDTGFEIGLSFDGISEHLVVPYSALKGFFDPSVQFGLQFDVAGANEKQKTPTQSAEIAEIGGAKIDKPSVASSKKPKNKEDLTAAPKRASGKKKDAKTSQNPKITDGEPGEKDADQTGEKVVSLDSFRKKT